MTGQPDADATRRDELRVNLAAVHRRVEAACVDAGRDGEEIALVVVTKFFPATDVRLLAELGVQHVGENRDQEARDKLGDPLLHDVPFSCHFIGQLQSNKAASVVRYADVIHTADRPKLVRALASAAEREGRRPRVLVQVSLDGAAGRGGVPLDAAAALADLVADQPTLELGGVMAVAPPDADPDRSFARLQEVATGIRQAHPDATWVSAGMSGDLEAAIRHGSTHLRVGTAILGSRPALR